MNKVTKKDIMSIPFGETFSFELDTPKACMSARVYAHQLGYTEGFVAKTKISGLRISITRIQKD